MKVFKNLSITTLAMLLTLPVMSMHHEEGTKDPMMKNMMTAKKWVEAGYTSKDKAMRMVKKYMACLLYTSPSPRDRQKSRMPSSA